MKMRIAISQADDDSWMAYGEENATDEAMLRYICHNNPGVENDRLYWVEVEVPSRVNESVLLHATVTEG